MASSARRVKVLVLVPELDRGGPTLGAVALARYLDRESFEVVVGVLGTAGRAAPSMVQQLREQGTRLVFFDIPGWGGLLKRKRVDRFVIDEAMDIVNSYGLRPDIVNFGLRRSCIALSSVRGMLRQEYTSRYGRLAAKVITAAHVYILKRMHRATVVSSAMLDYLVTEGLRQESLVYVPNFVDLQWVDRKELLETAPQGRHSAGAIQVGVVGSLIPRKRVDWAIRACSDLLRVHPGLNLQLHIVGDGVLREELRALVSKLGMGEVVVFHGHIDGVGAIMAGLDLFVLASESEGMPRSLMEAMSLGKTCLASNIGGVEELVMHGETGYLFDSSSYDDLVKKLGDILLKRAYLDPQRIMGYLEERFGAERGAQRLSGLFQELVTVSRVQDQAFPRR